MADVAATTLSTISVMQSALMTIASLALTTWRYPPNCTLTNGSSYDFIVIGSGTAGSVVASRLSENNNYSVLLIEAGPYPPLESLLPGLFTPLPLMVYDYDTHSVNDSITAQNLIDHIVSLTQGKMVGGSSSINHMIHVRGDPHDYELWSNITGDDRWNYDNLLPYFKKSEYLVDEDLLSKSSAKSHGTDGNLKITRETSSTSEFYLKAFAERGDKTVDDITTARLGACEPLFNIADGIRQSNAHGYLTPAKNRSNLCLAVSTKATKILIENGAAVGVQVTTAGGETYSLYAKKEVIVSAGAIHSPQLLMVSGIGPQEHLQSLNIPVVANLPVGQNLNDHLVVALLVLTQASNDPAPPQNPEIFPVPTVTQYAALDSSQEFPDYQTINLLFPQSSGAMVQLCSNVFKYSNDVCNTFYNATAGRNAIFAVHNVMLPKSRGKVLLASTNPDVEPLVYTGSYSDEEDLKQMSLYLEDYAKLVDTPSMRSVNAEIVDPGLCSGKTGLEYWRCYAIAMSATMWHYSGTCAMGSVLDSELRVKNVNNLRVIDASSMPELVSGNINAAVTVVGERGAAFILEKWSK